MPTKEKVIVEYHITVDVPDILPGDRRQWIKDEAVRLVTDPDYEMWRPDPIIEIVGEEV